MKKATIIYIYPNFSTFVQRDIAFLSEWYEVISPSTQWLKKSQTLLHLLTQFFYLLWKIPQSKAVLIMFGGFWSLIPTLLCKLFRKPSFIIIGGTDAVSFPHLGYGNLRANPLKMWIKWSYQLATELLPVHEALIKSEYTYDANAHFASQGVKAFFPDLKTSYEVIHNGFDSSFFNFDESQKKQNHFISIANIHENRMFQLKGFDLILDVASLIPEATFTLIGVSDLFKNQLLTIPKNVRIHSYQSQSELIKHLQESEFYLQLSISEGFPNALAEAMLCGCIPLVSNVASLPEIIGENGFVLYERDLKKAELLIKQAISFSIIQKKALAKSSRQKIEQDYSLSKRAQSFKLLLNRYIGF